LCGTATITNLITFNAAGAGRIERATSRHVGKPVAFLIDGKVVAVPTIRSPIRGQAQLSGDFTREEAERLATGMIGR
jgi:preprotein translocase subunit SecD